jgi:hypothetical protein
MRLKGYMLWVKGQLDATCRAPPWEHPPPQPRSVALQVAFERQTLKPIFSLDRL